MEAQKRTTLKEVAARNNTTVSRMIRHAVREHGSVDAAAKALGVKPMAVYQWVWRNGYRVETRARLVKKDTVSQ